MVVDPLSSSNKTRKNPVYAGLNIDCLARCGMRRSYVDCRVRDRGQRHIMNCCRRENRDESVATPLHHGSQPSPAQPPPNPGRQLAEDAVPGGPGIHPLRVTLKEQNPVPVGNPELPAACSESSDPCRCERIVQSADHHCAFVGSRGLIHYRRVAPMTAVMIHGDQHLAEAVARFSVARTRESMEKFS